MCTRFYNFVFRQNLFLNQKKNCTTYLLFSYIFKFPFKPLALNVTSDWFNIL